MTISTTCTALLAAAIITASAPAPTYIENFESFTPGPIDGQQGWASPAEADANIISVENNLAATYQIQELYSAIEWSLVSAPFQPTYGRLELDVTVTTSTENAFHHLATENPITGFLNTRIEFTNAGEIRIFHPKTSVQLGFEAGNTIASFTSGVPTRIAIETTPLGTLRIYQDDSLVHEGTDFTANLLGPSRAGKIGRVSVWSDSRRGFKQEASAITLDNITFTPHPCPTDFNADGATDSADLAALLTRWEDARPGGPADINADTAIDAADLTILLAQWGPCAG